MNKVEHRIAALELVVVELTPWLDELAIKDAMASIRLGLKGDIDPDERAIRLQALKLLEEGHGRFDRPPPGVKL